MEIQEVVARELLIPDLHRLIEAVGTSNFEKLLCASSRCIFGCEHITALAYSAAEVHAVIAESADARPVAKKAMGLYLDHYWNLDPVNRTVAGALANHQIYLLRMKRSEVTNSEYHCFASTNLAEIISLLRRCGDEFVRFNIYGVRPFRDRQLDALAHASSILIPLVAKHLEMRSNRVDNVNLSQTRKRIMQIQPNISEREADICAGIVLGMNTEAISLNLKISPNTVQTYRKRAYSKLGISTQNELMRLAFC